jgi:uncharacterized membrane protein
MKEAFAKGFVVATRVAAVVLTAAAVAAIFASLLAVCVMGPPLPIVQVDAATNECIRVMSKGGLYDCNTLPEKYEIEYVAPWWMRQEEDK